MTPQQIQLVQSTFRQIQPQADSVAQLFYRHLFERDPSLRAMFRGDMARQRALLMTMLGAAIQGLDRIDVLLPKLQALGTRHAGYGVTAAHYDTVGAALLDTLAAGLGEGFTQAARAAWTATYTLLAGAMQSRSEAAATA